MSWINELKSPGIQSKAPVESKAAANLWTKCVDCQAILYRIEIERGRFVCPKCDYHFPMPARDRVAPPGEPPGDAARGSASTDRR